MNELGEFEEKASWDIGHSNGRMNRNGQRRNYDGSLKRENFKYLSF